MLSLQISLTDAGLQHYREVLVCVFAYLKMLNEQGFQQWVYQENKRIADLHFKYKEKKADVARFVSSLAESVWYYSDRPELVL